MEQDETEQLRRTGEKRLRPIIEQLIKQRTTADDKLNRLLREMLLDVAVLGYTIGATDVLGSIGEVGKIMREKDLL